MAEAPTLTIRRDWPRPSDADLAAFRDAPTGWVVDAQGRRGALHHGIRVLTRATRILGAAFYPPICDDLALTYDVTYLRKVAAIVREAHARNPGAGLTDPGEVQHGGVLQVDLARVFGRVRDLQDIILAPCRKPGVLVAFRRKWADRTFLAEMPRSEGSKFGMGKGGVAGSEGVHSGPFLVGSEASQAERTK